MTIRDVLAHGVINYHPVIVGTAEEVADFMEEWFVNGACDGFAIQSDVSDHPKEKMELLMREEIRNFMLEHSSELNSRNGYYHRTFDTRVGRIESSMVPRDRQGEFQTALFGPFQRRDG